MSNQIHLWPEEMIKSNGQITNCVTVEWPNKERFYLWYRMSQRHQSLLTKMIDPFVAAMIFPAMRRSNDLMIHGAVSLSLLRNLEEFQGAWSCWLPKTYNKIQIQPDVELKLPKVEPSDKAVTAFSGGIDSCFTVWHHCNNNSNISSHDLQAGVMIHGFDIALKESQIFTKAVDKSKRILDSLGVELITVATNFRQLDGDWKDTHAAALASSLLMFEGGFDVGLIPASPAYDNISVRPPWGSNPITDRMLSSDSFEIVHDGTAYSRADKILQIADWPEAMRNLRVCWEGEQKDRNCGVCEKCIRTILNFKALGLELPECFERDISNSQIAGIKGLDKQHLFDYLKILKRAKEAEIRESWVDALESCIEHNQRQLGEENHWRKLGKKIGFRRHLHRLGIGAGK